GCGYQNAVMQPCSEAPKFLLARLEFSNTFFKNFFFDVAMLSDPNRRVWIWVDASAFCNLRCRLCYTLSLQSRGGVCHCLIFKRSLSKYSQVLFRCTDFTLTGVANHSRISSRQKC